MLKRIWEEAREDYAFDQAWSWTLQDGEKPMPFIWHLWQCFKYELLGLYCKLYGHDIEDDSYGGPDTGCMAGHCKRCGWSYHTTLY